MRFQKLIQIGKVKVHTDDGEICPALQIDRRNIGNNRLIDIGIEIRLHPGCLLILKRSIEPAHVFLIGLIIYGKVCRRNFLQFSVSIRIRIESSGCTVSQARVIANIRRYQTVDILRGGNNQLIHFLLVSLEIRHIFCLNLCFIRQNVAGIGK